MPVVRLVPGVEHAPALHLSSSRGVLGAVRPPTGIGASAVALAPPSAAATSSEPECAMRGCGITAAKVYTGYCQAHHDAFLAFGYEHARSIGRGSFDA